MTSNLSRKAAAAASASELRRLAKEGFLHPSPCGASAYQKKIEKLAAAGTSAEALFMAQAHLWGGWVPLLRFAPAAAARVKAARGLLALAATEAASGADIYSLATTARPARGGWLLSGRKTFITNATIASHLLVLARPTTSTHAQDLACFLVPAKARGLQRKKLPALTGLCGADVGELVLKNVLVKEENLVGTLRQGADVFRLAMAWERSMIFSPAPALLEKLSAPIAGQAAKKIRGGKPLLDNPVFSSRLAEARAQAGRIRSLISEAATTLDSGRNALIISTRVKVEASRLYESASRTLLQLGGKEAFLSGSALEKNFRDSLAGSLYSGPNDALEALFEEKI